MSDLPVGWAHATIDQITAFERNALAIGPFGSNLKVSDYRSSGVPLVFVRNVRSRVFEPTSLRYVSHEKAAALRAHQVSQGDLLITKMGDPPGDAAIYPLHQPGIITADCIKLTPHPSVSAQYLLYALAMPDVALQISAITQGVAQRKVSLERFRVGIKIPLAPVAEQKRIVAAIEEQFSRLDVGVTALERARQNLRSLRASVLQSAVIGQLVPHSGDDVEGMLERINAERRRIWRNATSKLYREPASPAEFQLSIPKHWRIASLEAITDPVRVICYGILMPKEHVDDGVPYVRVKDMKGWTVDVEGLKRTSLKIAAQYARASLKAGDLLLAIRGSYGRAAIIPPDLDGGNITQDSARIAPCPEINKRYLLYYLGGSVANRYYAQVARGVAVKGVNIGDLRCMPVPVPPPREQEAIADEIERQFSFLDSAETEVQRQVTNASSLRSSILAAAYTGKLTFQDPRDEPASKLLERIVAERVSSNGHGRARGRSSRLLREGTIA